MGLQEKVKKLLQLRLEIDNKTKELEPLKSERDEVQQEIIKEMTNIGFNSIKTDDATISKMIRKTLVITDEKELVADLKERKLNDYISERINKDLWLSFSKESIKQGVDFKGTEINESEYISIRNNKIRKAE